MKTETDDEMSEDGESEDDTDDELMEESTKLMFIYQGPFNINITVALV